MRILLASICIAVALAAPVNVEENPDELDAAEELDSNAPHIRVRRDSVRDFVWKMRSMGLPEAAIAQYFKNGFHLPPFNQERMDRIAEWGKQFNISITEPDSPERKADFLEKTSHIEDILTDHLQLIPESAVAEFYSEGFHLTPVTEEKYSRIISWAKKWNVKEIAEMGYDSEKQSLVPAEEISKPEAATLTEKEREINAKLAAAGGAIGQILRERGLPERAIVEFFANQFHQRPFTDEKNNRFMDWIKKWNVHSGKEKDQKAVAPTLENSIRDQLRSFEEAIYEYLSDGLYNPPFDHAKINAVNAWAFKWNINPSEFTKDMPHATGTPLRTLEETIRDQFRSKGLPAQAIEEYFDHGLHQYPYDHEKVEAITKWAMKWNIPVFWNTPIDTDESDDVKQEAEVTIENIPNEETKGDEVEIVAKSDDSMNEMGLEIADEVYSVFANTHTITKVMRDLSDNDEITDDEKRQIVQRFLDNLPEYDRGVLERVIADMTKKVSIKYGFVKEAEMVEPLHGEQ